MKRLLFVVLGLASHAAFLAAGFILGIYFLPIMMARPSPDAATLQALSAEAVYTAEIVEDLRGALQLAHHTFYQCPSKSSNIELST